MDTTSEKFWTEFNAYESIDWQQQQHREEEEEEALENDNNATGANGAANSFFSEPATSATTRRRTTSSEHQNEDGGNDIGNNDDDDENTRHYAADNSSGDGHHQQRLHQQQRRHVITSSIACLAFFQRLFLSTQVWLAALVVGCCCGLLSATLEVVTHWLTDLKIGVCTHFFGASEELCCLHTTHSGRARDIAAAALAATSSSSSSVSAATWRQESSFKGVPDPGVLQLLYAHCHSFSTWTEMFGGHGSAGVLVYVVMGTLFAVTASWVCTEWAPQAAGSGIVEIKTILSGIQIPGYLTPRVLLVKSTTLCLSVGSGLTLGKEGPFVHLGSCIGNIVASAFPRYRANEAARRELISVGAGAGVAVAFGAPIGGVLFAYEEVAKYFPHRAMLQGFLCSIVATLVVKSIDPSHSGRLVQFSVSYRYGWHWFELLGFVVLGVMGGFVGGNLVRYNFLWNKRRKTNPNSIAQREPITEVAIVALATTVLCAGLNISFLKEGMLEGLSELFVNCPENSSRGICNSSASDVRIIFQLLMTGLVRCALMVVTFGIRVPAGCFVPALFIGACFGRAFGTFLKLFYENYDTFILFSECGAKDPSAHEGVCIIPGVYAIVGACAVLAGVTRMTLALVVIMFELTGGLEYVVPCMISAILAKWFAEYWLRVPSVYDTGLRLTCYPYVNTESDVDAKKKIHTHSVGDLVLAVRSLRDRHPRHHQHQHHEQQEQQDREMDRVETSNSSNNNNPPTPTSPPASDNNSSATSLATLWNFMSVADLQRILEATHYKWYPIVRSTSSMAKSGGGFSDSTYVGCISVAQLRQELEIVKATSAIGVSSAQTAAASAAVLIAFEPNATTGPSPASTPTIPAPAAATTGMMVNDGSQGHTRTGSSYSSSTTPLSSPVAASHHHHHQQHVVLLDWSHLVDPCRISCSWEMPLLRLQKIFDLLGVQFVPVLNGNNNKLAAVVTRKDLIAYLRSNR